MSFVMMKLLVIPLLLAASALVTGKHEQYIGYKTYRVKPVGSDQLNALGNTFEWPGVDVWQAPTQSGREGYVMIPPQSQKLFEEILELTGIKFSIYIEDVKRAFDQDDEMLEEANTRVKSRQDGRRISFDAYYRHSDINAYLEDLAETYPDRVTIHTGGQSFEGRDIKYIKISTSGFQDESKPVFVMEAAIHAREWIAPPVALYSIYKLVENVTEAHLAEKIDWIIIPVLNPDGYEHTHDSNRLWRKTRSTEHTWGDFCPGVDGNRNFPYQWGTTGASANPCVETFRGPAAFSEVEARVLRDILLENLSRIKFYLSVHSFGSYILYPWSWNGQVPSNGLELHTLGVKAAEAIKSATIPIFEDYIVGNAASALNYLASGSSADYALSIGIDLSYVFELPGLGLGTNGFVLSPELIHQVVTETWEGIIVFAEYII